MPKALLGKLAGRSSHAVIMALGARRRVENRTQSSAGIMFSFKLCLIHSECVARRLRDPVTNALRSGIPCYFTCWADSLSKRGGSEACWSFRGLLCDEGYCGSANDK